MDRTTSRASGGITAQARNRGPGSVGAAAQDPSWYVISEDRSLSLRVVSGAILCEGEGGELVVSVEQAAHAARFDIIDDALLLSCLSGRIRANGRPVTTHHQIAAGAQIHIGHTRYFIAGEISEEAPDVPLLDNAMEPGDSRLPKPSKHRLPVFYSGPLEIEEIIIAEPAEMASARDETDAASAKPARSATPSTSPRTSPDRTPANPRGRMPSLLLAGLLASATFAGWQLVSTAEDPLFLAVADPLARVLSDTPRAKTIPPATVAAAPSRLLESGEDDPVMVALAYLAWADDISATHHAQFVETVASLDPAVLTGVVREHIDHYARRLIRDVSDADRLEDMVMSLGPLLAPHPAYRGTLASLEKRVGELSRRAEPPLPDHGAEHHIAAIDASARARELE